MKMTKEAKLHFDTAVLLMKGLEQSFDVKPNQWGIIPRNTLRSQSNADVCK